MEIQDRNSLLQILSAAQDGKVKSSYEDETLFAGLLKSVKDEVSFPQNDSKNPKLRLYSQQVEVSEKNEYKVVDKKDKAFKKTEVENKKISNVKKEEGKQTSKKNNAASQYNSDGGKTETVNKTEVINSSVQTTGNVSENQVDKDYAEGKIAEDVIADANTDLFADVDTEVDVEDLINAVPMTMAVQVSEDMVVSEEVFVEDITNFDQGTHLSETLKDLFVEASSESKQDVVAKDFVKTSQNTAEDFMILSEEEKVLVEQAKFFDEKVAHDKKSKIEVGVSEEKIADPIVKSVLKNRFVIDSMFQSVDENTDVLMSDAENVVEDIIADDKNTNTSLETKNVLFNEAKAVQDVAKSAFGKDTTIMAVSGKEVVAEFANASKNEAFVKINETTSRDTFKGMAKEVVEQIKVNITKSAVRGVDTIDIQLKPEDLGKVQVKMHIAKDGKIQAEIITSRAETAELLQKDASLLSKAFNDAGYNTDDKSFTFSFQNENQAKGQEKDDTGLLKFIGETLEQEAENIAGNDNLGYDPVLGLNIRV